MATIESQETDASRARRYSQAAILLHRWMTEEPDYDQRVGKLLDEELIDNVMRC